MNTTSILFAFTKLSKQTHIVPKIVYQSNDLTILKSMIRENIGIGFLTEIAIHPEDNLVAIPLADTAQPRFLISLATRAQQLPTVLHENVIEVIHEFMKTQKWLAQLTHNKKQKKSAEISLNTLFDFDFN